MARYDESCVVSANPRTIPNKMVDNRERMNEMLSCLIHIRNQLILTPDQGCDPKNPPVDCLVSEIDVQSMILNRMLDELNTIVSILG